MKVKQLFDHPQKNCSWCNCPLPLDYEEDMCPNCLEEALFRKVRDFVRENDVNEFEVAEEFQIPLKQVKIWIRQGRLEYKDNDLTLKNLHCEICGKPVQFGVLCTDCMRKSNINGGFTARKANVGEQIRFYNK